MENACCTDHPGFEQKTH